MTGRRYKRERVLFGLRWRGRLNLKDVVERYIASFLGGVSAGLMFWLLVTLAGGM